MFKRSILSLSFKRERVALSYIEDTQIRFNLKLISAQHKEGNILLRNNKALSINSAGDAIGAFCNETWDLIQGGTLLSTVIWNSQQRHLAETNPLSH